MRKEGLLIKKNETCKITVTSYESKEERVIEILNGEILDNTEEFKLQGNKIDNNGYFLEGIIDNSGKFIGNTKNIILTSKCE